MNKRVADFEARLERTGMAELIRNACAAIKRRLFIRRQPQRRSKQPQETGEAKAQWARQWSEGAISTDDAIIRDWQQRYQKQKAEAWVRRPLRQV